LNFDSLDISLNMRAVLCGYYGMGNAGDEALLASLLQMLPDPVKPIVLSGNPQQTRDRYGVTSYDRKSLPALLRTLRLGDAFIWGGGSLMQDATSALNPAYYGGLMRSAQVMGLTTIAWAQGIGPLNRPLTHWLARQVFRHCSQVSVRDRAAAALLDQWRIPYVLAPDPVWAMATQPGASDLSDQPSPAQQRVAVNLRDHPQLTVGRLAILTQALRLFQQETQVELLLVPFQASRDLAIAQTLKAQLPGPTTVIHIPHPQVLKGWFQTTALTISMRLHGVIMAAAEGNRCFALSYDPKVSQLMQDVGLPGCELAELPIDAHALSQTWIDLYRYGQPLGEPQRRSLVEQALRHQQVLHQALLPQSKAKF
jgi:polysaccharide pyruvyl transferase CsaB